MLKKTISEEQVKQELEKIFRKKNWNFELTKVKTDEIECCSPFVINVEMKLFQGDLWNNEKYLALRKKLEKKFIVQNYKISAEKPDIVTFSATQKLTAVWWWSGFR